MPTSALADRRRVITSIMALGTMGILGQGYAANRAGAKTAVGFIYVGATNDMGYNQAHAAGARAVAALPGIEVHELSNVPEGREVGEAFDLLVRQKHCRIIFATSYGYFMPYLLEAASKFPDTIFCMPARYFVPAFTRRMSLAILRTSMKRSLSAATWRDHSARPVIWGLSRPGRFRKCCAM